MPAALRGVDPGDLTSPTCASCRVRCEALFGPLQEADLRQVQSAIADMKVRTGCRLFARGTVGPAAFTIRSGLVRFERETERGERRIVRLAGRGDLIGQEALLNRSYADDAIACTAVHLCRIPRSVVQDVAGIRQALAHELMLRAQLALEAAEAWVADLSTGPARLRLLQMLSRLAKFEEAGGTIWLPRREDMGAMLDMAEETASRLISALRREGVIAPVGNRRARLNPGALERALRAERVA